jgi:hypothetical protein
MPDNPRFPEHHSDIPSSRPSGETPNPVSPYSGSSYNPPPQSNVPPTKTHVRNLMIGAVVTIFTSTVVFLITQYLKKPEGNEFQQKKDATVETWRSYVGYENAYFQNIMSYQNILQTEGRNAFLKALKAESEKFITDVQDLKKRKNIDDDLVKVFSKRIENEKASLPPVEQYYEKLNAIDAGNQSIKEKKDNITNEMIRFAGLNKGMYERALNDIKEIAKVLAGRYGGSFSMHDFLLVQKAPQLMRTLDSAIIIMQNVILDSSGQIIENRNFSKNVNRDNLVGKWTIPDAVITFSKNGKMSWLVKDGNTAEGTWKIVNDKLEIEATTTTDKKKIYWRFNLAHITINSFMMMMDSTPYNIYNLTRTLD